jgi:hypothetical protein
MFGVEVSIVRRKYDKSLIEYALIFELFYDTFCVEKCSW